MKNYVSSELSANSNYAALFLCSNAYSTNGKENIPQK